VIRGQRDHHEVVARHVGGHRIERGLLGLAHPAPRRPEVEQHDLAAIIGQLDVLAGDVLGGEVGRGHRQRARRAARAQRRVELGLDLHAATCGLQLARCRVRHHPQEHGEHDDADQRDATTDEQHARVDHDAAPAGS
jgi:hypothetical protein